LISSHSLDPAALAAVSCLRSLAGFVFPLFAPDMYKSLGFGRADTLLAGIAILVGCPAYALLSAANCCSSSDVL
jgi:hypothetical protein